MGSARSFFFLLFLAGLATEALAADKPAQMQASSGSFQHSVAPQAGPTTQPEQGSSPLMSSMSSADKRPTLNHPPVLRTPLASLNDGVCYTMRMYKVKPKEHFAEDEGGTRGYSICEMASNYQLRSAIAHQRRFESPQEEPRK